MLTMSIYPYQIEYTTDTRTHIVYIFINHLTLGSFHLYISLKFLILFLAKFNILLLVTTCYQVKHNKTRYMRMLCQISEPLQKRILRNELLLFSLFASHLDS